MQIETLAVHAGSRIDPTTRGVAPPIHLSTTFERAADGSFPSGYIYLRDANPNRTELETAIAELEGGAAAFAFASGSAATAAVFQALAPGDHVVAPLEAYYGTGKLLRDLFQRWGLAADFVETDRIEAVRAALRPSTRLVWIETPSNPNLRVTDIAATAEAARSVGALLVCDNTWATPLLQRPFAHGADLVVHSTTKYFGGHSDVQGGAVVCRTEGDLAARLRRIQIDGGAVPSPFDSWLVRRGIRTLACRLRAQCDGAEAIAAFLAAHPAVERVLYPGLAGDPGRAASLRQMTRPGAMLSLVVRGGRERAMAVAAKVRLITRATSLGGVETLIEHRASVEGPTTRAAEGLLRVSVGLEHPDDLVADLAQALG